MSAPAGVIDLSVWQLAVALVLVAAVVVVSIRQSLGLERDLVIGSVRTIVQLYAVGLVLAAVFAAARWYWVVLILMAMAAVATQAAVSRLGKPLPGGGWIAGTALTVSTAATLAYVIGVVVQVRPWWEPQYIIPIAGDRKSTRLNSSHGYISYAVFCLKKKKKDDTICRLLSDYAE